MRPLPRDLAACLAIAFLSAVSIFLFLTWAARLPRIGFVPFAASCERANTLGTWVWVFVIVFSLGIMGVVLRELKRRAFEELGQRTAHRESDEKDSRK